MYNYTVYLHCTCVTSYPQVAVRVVIKVSNNSEYACEVSASLASTMNFSQSDISESS